MAEETRHARRIAAMDPTQLAGYKARRAVDYQRRKAADPDAMRAKGREVARRQRQTRADAINERQREHYAADPERHVAYQRDYAKRHPEVLMEKQYRRYYGIGTADYERMFSAQGGLCAICNKPESMTLRGEVKRLSVDHDHDTGAVRGLLCSACNRAIGWLGDDPERVANAAAYLAGHKPVLRLVS